MSNTDNIDKMETLLSTVSETFQISTCEIKGRSHEKRICSARHTFSLIARQDYRLSFPVIGRFLNRDHTTIMSSLRRAEAYLRHPKSNPAFVGKIKAVRTKLYELEERRAA